MKNAFTFILAFIVTAGLQAQVVINEYSASNLIGHTDSHGKTEDWIELYNTSNQDVDISGWHLSDKSSKTKKWEIPAGIVIPANGYLVFYCSGRDKIYYGEYHTNFKLSQTKGDETLLLTDPDGEVLQEIPYATTLIGHDMSFIGQGQNSRYVITLEETSRCRVIDGADQWMICTTPSIGFTNNTGDKYSGYTAQPTIELTAGFYDGPQSITITNNDENAILRYTTDGTNPTMESEEYTAPIEISANTVVKARAFSNDPLVLPGKMDFATFFIDEDISLAVFSIAADGIDLLANDDNDIFSTTFNPVGSLEYFDVDGNLQSQTFGNLNRHGQDSWALDHRSIDWVSRDEMGYNKSIDAKLFSYSDRDEYQRVIFRASGDDNYPARENGFTDQNHQGSTHIRDEFVHTLAQEGNMKLDVRAVERVVLFLNGTYWGVYGLRERPVDHDYIGEYYDHDKTEIQFLSTWGSTEAEYGGYAALYDWLQFREFIMNNDMSDSDNYQKVKDQLQVQSLMDYMIANLNSVASDWLNYNTGWWRGLNPEGQHKKWGYILWDNDATFDYYINYSGVPNIDTDAVPCDIDEISDYMDEFFGGWGGSQGFIYVDPATCSTIDNETSPYDESDPIFNLVINQIETCCTSNWDSNCQSLYDEIKINGTNPSEELSVQGNIGKHEKIFLKLQDESTEFRQHYYSRQADLINTVYTCENMLSTLDRMVDVIKPEMPRQIARWGGSMTEWENNVSRLRSFVEERCELLDEGMTECFDITGPYNLTLNTFPEGVGEIDLNTLDIREMPWTGRYFGEMDNLIKARAFDPDEYFFSHWETANGSVIADVNAFQTSIVLEEDEELTAVFSTDPTSTNETLSGHTFDIYPNPASDFITLNYDLAVAAEVQIDLYNTLGQKITNLPEIGGYKSAGSHTSRIDFTNLSITTGVHIVEVTAGEDKLSFRVMVID